MVRSDSKIDENCERKLKEKGEIRKKEKETVRGVEGLYLSLY